MIRIGTSGFSYKDWVGPFYPLDLPREEWLSYYAGEFDTTELNFTYYRQPDSKTLSRMVQKVPTGFQFSVKAFQKLTHSRDAESADFQEFIAGVQPLVEAGMLACILAQFPYSFHATQGNAAYLGRLREELANLPVVVEFRNVQWIKPKTFDYLRSLDLGFCCADQPQLKGLIPPIAEATSDIAYVRFHGRNAAKWWRHDEAWERYDYRYSEIELLEWVPKLRTLDEAAETTFVYANNHWQGQAIDAARQLKLMLLDETL